jgi:hypothetical protein
MGRQRFGQAQGDPGAHGQAQNGGEAEDPAPPGEQQDALPDGGRDHRHDHEDDEDQRLGAGHPVPLEPVAQDGAAHGAEAAGEQAAEEAQDEQHGEIARQRAQPADHRAGNHAAKQHRPAPEAIGQGPRDQRAQRDADEEQADHQLLPVGIGNRQFARDLAQRGQDRIDGERLQCLRKGKHHNQFAGG